MQKGFFSPKISALIIVLLCCLTVQCGFPQNIQSSAESETEPFSINKSPLPAPTGFINDYVGVIDAATKQKLERRLTDLRARTQVEIAVAVVKTTNGRDILEYSLAVARGWGIGSKEDDNPSALLFIAIDDRKYFTQVSKDLQDELPDGLAGQLQRQYLVPAFKQQNYAKGVEDTIEAYIRAIEAKQTSGAPPVSKTNERKTEEKGSSAGFGLCNIMVCLIILFILLIIIFSRSGKSRRDGNDRNRWGGGGGFGSGGSALPWIIGSILANSASGRSSGGWSDSSSDWGGSTGGGWGGFGGGGDFDGGGAGGSW